MTGILVALVIVAVFAGLAWYVAREVRCRPSRSRSRAADGAMMYYPVYGGSDDRGESGSDSDGGDWGGGSDGGSWGGGSDGGGGGGGDGGGGGGGDGGG